MKKTTMNINGKLYSLILEDSTPLLRMPMMNKLSLPLTLYDCECGLCSALVQYE